MVVSVLDRQGKPVAGLTAADFRGEFRGQPVQILSAVFDTSAPRIVVLLDISSSMTRQEAKWRLVRTVAESIVSGASPDVSLALVTFSEQIEGKAGFEQDRQVLAERLGKFEPGRQRPGGSRRTALWDVIGEGLVQLDHSSPGDVVYVISDGGDNMSRGTPKQLERAFLSAGVRLFAFIFFNPRSPAGSQSMRLQKLVERTGGTYAQLLPPPDASPLSSSKPPSYTASKKYLAKAALAARKHFSQIAGFYRLEVELPQQEDKWRGWKLEVMDEQGKKKKMLKVNYPRRLMPCPIETDENHPGTGGKPLPIVGHSLNFAK